MDPSLADRFLLRGSVVDFDPASSASINSELSCSNAVAIKKKVIMSNVKYDGHL